MFIRMCINCISLCPWNYFLTHTIFYFFSVWLLSVLCGHSGFFIPATTAKDLRLRRISIPDLIHYIIFLSYFLRKSQYFPFSMFSTKQVNYWYHFYNVFGMTRSLTGDWTLDLPHSKPALYHQAIEEAVRYTQYETREQRQFSVVLFKGVLSLNI